MKLYEIQYIVSIAYANLLFTLLSVCNSLDFEFVIPIFQVTDTRGNLQHGTRPFNPNPAYTGIGNVFSRVYTEGGVRGLYRGIGRC